MSKYGLIGMVSGAGQGLAAGASQAMQFVGASMLQKERMAMDERRMQLTEQYASEREQRGQDFQRGLQQERLGADMLVRSQDRQALDEREQRSQDFQRGLQQEEIGTDITLTSMRQDHDKGIRDQDRAERKEELASKLKQDERQHDDKMDLERQELAIARLQHGDEVKEVQAGEDGTQWAVMKSGQTKPLLNPTTNEPIKGPKGLSEAAKETVSFIEKRIAAKEKLASDPMTSPEEATKLRREIDSLSRNAMLILGNKEKEKTGPVQIVDPDDVKNPAEPMTTNASDKKPVEPSPPSGMSQITGMSELPSIGAKIKEKGGTLAATIVGMEKPETAVAGGDQSPSFVDRVVEGTKGLVGNVVGAFSSPSAPSVVSKESQEDWRNKYDAKPEPKGFPLLASARGLIPASLASATPPVTSAAADVTDDSRDPELPSRDLYADMNDVFASKDLKPVDVFASTEFADLPDHKQATLRSVYQKYQQGDLSRSVLISSVHAILDDTWGMIRAEMVARLLIGEMKGA